MGSGPLLNSTYRAWLLCISWLPGWALPLGTTAWYVPIVSTCSVVDLSPARGQAWLSLQTLVPPQVIYRNTERGGGTQDWRRRAYLWMQNNILSTLTLEVQADGPGSQSWILLQCKDQGSSVPWFSPQDLPSSLSLSLGVALPLSIPGPPSHRTPPCTPSQLTRIMASM